MTFKELAEYATRRGFEVTQEEKVYALYLKRKDGIIVETSFLIEEGDIRYSDALSWEFILKNGMTQKEIYKRWIEHYGAISVDELMDNYKNEIINFIDGISKYEIRIQEVILFSLFKIKFGKSEILEFKTENGWSTIGDC